MRCYNADEVRRLRITTKSTPPTIAPRAASASKMATIGRPDPAEPVESVEPVAAGSGGELGGAAVEPWTASAWLAAIMGEAAATSAPVEVGVGVDDAVAAAAEFEVAPAAGGVIAGAFAGVGVGLAVTIGAAVGFGVGFGVGVDVDGTVTYVANA